MTIKEVVEEYFGTQLAMAKIMKVSNTAVNQWVQNDYMPISRALTVEFYTMGEVKAVDLVKDDLKHILKMVKR